MRWVLLWVVLVLAAGAVLGLLGRSLWRKAKALTVEMTEASERMSAVAASISELAQQAGGPPGAGVGGDDPWSRYEQPAAGPPAEGRRRRRS